MGQDAKRYEITVAGNNLIQLNSILYGSHWDLPQSEARMFNVAVVVMLINN